MRSAPRPETRRHSRRGTADAQAIQIARRGNPAKPKSGGSHAGKLGVQARSQSLHRRGMGKERGVSLAHEYARLAEDRSGPPGQQPDRPDRERRTKLFSRIDGPNYRGHRVSAIGFADADHGFRGHSGVRRRGIPPASHDRTAGSGSHDDQLHAASRIAKALCWIESRLNPLAASRVADIARSERAAGNRLRSSVKASADAQAQAQAAVRAAHARAARLLRALADRPAPDDACPRGCIVNVPTDPD